jgi:hypothetical protein
MSLSGRLPNDKIDVNSIGPISTSSSCKTTYSRSDKSLPGSEEMAWRVRKILIVNLI